MSDERKKGTMSVEEAGRMGGKKVGEGPLRLMVENSTKKSVIKVGKRFVNLSKKEKSTKESDQFLVCSLAGSKFGFYGGDLVERR